MVLNTATMAKVLVNAGDITHSKPLSTFYVIISLRIYIQLEIHAVGKWVVELCPELPPSIDAI
jgi:hypothetical protein